MTGQQFIHFGIPQAHLLFFLQSRQIHRRSVSADLPVGLVGNGCFVENAIVLIPRNMLTFAPLAL